ncbi:Signal transduction histidine kinase [Agreia bicolorata]|uniref:histidine kinase n=1 Tax=Agreia bicolorata TaxID=110935 RepID=A0A1T4XI30_9MICO|nr:PAS domain-containing sensor histidine kinase [Agreia bicolorata]SKA89232.1 Signal transduction histidine kinase [Agreia bicolorata]
MVRSAVERSVFLSQLLLAGATLVLAMISFVVDPLALSSPMFFAGVVAIFAVTGLAAAVPWRRIAKIWIACLPLLDILAIALIRQDQPQLGATLLFVFPAIWMSMHFGFWGGAVSVVLPALLIWGGEFMRDSDKTIDPAILPRLGIVPIVLAFVATTVYSTTRRASAQRSLLQQQAHLFEQALQSSRRQKQTLDELFDAVDFGVIGFDGSARINLINRAQREMVAPFALGEESIVPAVVYREDRTTPYEEYDRPIQRALRGETIDRETVWFGEPGDEQAAILTSSRPVIDEQGDYDGGVIVFRDVTAELKAVKARDDLVASVSHELRTPLTSIVGYTELALDEDIPDTARAMLEVTSRNADRMLAIVADLLAAASESTQTLLMVFAPCDLAQIVRDGIESITPVASISHITFTTPELEPLVFDADAFRLRQVVDNILSNAVKYNVGYGHIDVSLRATPDGTAELRVHDTGRGMTDAEQARLFDRFYRADSVRNSAVHGSGLGLSISRDIVHRHGGELRLESARGKGTTAIMSIPMKDREPAGDSSPESKAAP